MIFADFNTEDVKTYQRLSKGKLVTVQQHNRKGEDAQTQATDRAINSNLQTGAAVTAGVALAGLSLVGIGMATKAYVVGKHTQQVANAAKRIQQNPAIDNLQFLSKANPSKLPDDFSQYEGVIISTGGFGGSKGGHSLQVDIYIKQEYPNHFILSVENVYNDLGWNPAVGDRLKQAPGTLWGNATKGNRTAEELAKIANLVRSKTDKPITFMTGSGGGMAVKEAQEITDTLRLKDIQGIGMGSPTFGLANPKSPYVSFIDKDDATVGAIPLLSQKDTQYISRGSNKVKWNMADYQGEIEWSKQHEFGTYLMHPGTRAKTDSILYRNRPDKSMFKPENYTVDVKNNTTRNRNLTPRASQYSRLEQQAWANFDVLFPSTVSADFSGEQDVKVKSYVRNGKLVRQYTAKRDKSIQDPNLIERLRNNVSGTVEKKTGNESLARTLGTVAVVGAVGTAGIVGGKILLGTAEVAAIGSATKAWDRAYPKRVDMIESFADDLVAGRKLFRGQKLNDFIGDADTVFTVKGGINMGGTGGTTIKNDYLKGMASPRDKWAILDLDNLELDSRGVSNGKINLGQTVKDLWGNFTTNVFTKGYNKDSIEVAGYMRAVEKLRPNTNKVMIGYSAGAVATNAAAADLSKMRSVTRLKSINFGLPYTGIAKVQDGNRVVDQVTFINSDDILANTGLSRGSKGDINAILQERPNKKQETGILAGHSPRSYFGDPEQRKRIYKVIKNGSLGAQ